MPCLAVEILEFTVNEKVVEYRRREARWLFAENYLPPAHNEMRSR